MFSQILGTGAAFPKQVITNQSLSLQVGLSEEEIERRTGVLTRYWVTEGETAATLAIEAARKALQDADLPAAAIGLIIVSTSSPDRLFPSVACFVQNEVGCRAIPAFDINASCSGFLYALALADQFIRGDVIQYALVIASEVKSVYLDKKQPQTALLFGDGAGAIVFASPHAIAKKKSYRLRSVRVFSGGPNQPLIRLPSGGSRSPLSLEGISQGHHVMEMQGTRLFRLAVKKMDEAISGLLNEQALLLEAIDLFIFHQANARILEAVLQKQGISPTKHHTTISRFGNTSSSSIPIALDDAIRSGKTAFAQRIGLCAFGGGFTWGYALLEAQERGKRLNEGD